MAGTLVHFPLSQLARGVVNYVESKRRVLMQHTDTRGSRIRMNSSEDSDITALIDRVESLIDDSAALGNSDRLQRLTRSLLLLSDASKDRSRAVDMRLSGDIVEALRCESSCDENIKQARWQNWREIPVGVSTPAGVFVLPAETVEDVRQLFYCLSMPDSAVPMAGVLSFKRLVARMKEEKLEDTAMRDVVSSITGRPVDIEVFEEAMETLK